MSEVEITQFNHPCILITITNIYGDGYDLYSQVRYAWRINPEKAKDYPYVMAVQGGIIQEVYKVDEEKGWQPATPENFPEIARASQEHSNRYGFTGTPARDIRMEYVGKKVPDEHRGQFPVRYIDI